MSVGHLYVCLCVSLQKPHFPVDWRPRVEERVTNIGTHLDIFCVFAISGAVDTKHATRDTLHMTIIINYQVSVNFIRKSQHY